jgi:hypothetical protein
MQIEKISVATHMELEKKSLRPLQQGNLSCEQHAIAKNICCAFCNNVSQLQPQCNGKILVATHM